MVQQFPRDWLDLIEHNINRAKETTQLRLQGNDSESEDNEEYYEVNYDENKEHGDVNNKFQR